MGFEVTLRAVVDSLLANGHARFKDCNRGGDRLRDDPRWKFGVPGLTVANKLWFNILDYTAEKVRTLCASPDELRARWAHAGQRADVIQQLAERGIDFQTVALQAGKPEADPFDLLCHLAFNAPVLTRRQRADRVKKQETAFFDYFGPEAREILNDLLEKYATDGELQFTLPDVLKLPPISHHGNVAEIIGVFGGADHLRNAVNQLQTLLCAA